MVNTFMTDLLILMVMGGLFVILGLAVIFWDRSEQKNYYNAISPRRVDVREYMEQSPKRPEFEAIKVGGRIAIIIGLVLFIMGGVFWLWG